MGETRTAPWNIVMSVFLLLTCLCVHTVFATTSIAPPSSTQVDNCVNHTCDNSAACVNGESNYTCNCTTGWEGPMCSQVDNCVNHTCDNSAACVNGESNYTCNCTTGWEGPMCSQDISDCVPSPCKNNGDCTDTGVNTYMCNCTGTGYNGTTCEEDANDCINSTCLHDGHCMDTGTNSYKCNCTDGWLGLNCDIVDYCVNHTCNNGAVCINGESNYTCNCTSGWEGPMCNQDISDCASVPCKNNGSCTDTGVNSFMCDCTGTGYNGTTCEDDANDCINNPCLHGQCMDTGTNSFKCNCTVGWLGGNCTLADYCVNHTCDNGAACVNGESNYTCNCTTGWEGPMCNQDVDDCTNSTCLNDGQCMDTGTNSYKCNCTVGWQGSTCENDVPECADAGRCINGGYCHEKMGNYSCICQTGWTGRDCSEDVDECKTKTECNGAGYNCTNTNGSSICECNPGYMMKGPQCQEIMLLPDKEDSTKYTVKDQVVGPETLDARVPVFNKLYSNIYVSMNGYLTFGDKYVNSYPPKNISDWSDAAMLKMVAPYWWYNDVSENGGMYISQWHAVVEADKEMVDKVSKIIADKFKNVSKTEMVFMATWHNFTPFPSSEFSKSAITFQVVIATDGRQSYAMFNYDSVWGDNPSRQPASLITGTANMMVQNTPQPGNNQRLVIPLFDGSPMMNNTDFECIHKLWQLPMGSYSSSSCPCTVDQAEQDLQFNMMPNTTTVQCYQNVFPQGNNKTTRQKCCYDKTFNSLLGVEDKKAGYAVFSDDTVNQLQTQAHEACCGTSSSKCPSFYSMFPPSTCQDYNNLLALSWGDPHFNNFQSRGYTFNGLGEYVLLKVAESNFEAQIRTDRVAMTGDGLGNATVIVHLAIKYSDLTVEIMETSGQFVMYVNSEQVEDLSNDVMVINKDGAMYTAVFSNGISFVVTPFDGYISISVTMTTGTVTSGLLGNADEPVTPETESKLFIRGQKYLVKDDNSLFNYSLQAENFSTNQNPDFSPTFYRDLYAQGLDALFSGDNATKQAAVAFCKDVRECLLDYAATSNENFANATLMDYQKFMKRKTLMVNGSQESVKYEYITWNLTDDNQDYEVTKMIDMVNSTIETNIDEMYYTFNSSTKEFKLNVSMLMSNWYIRFKTDKVILQPTIYVCMCKQASECLHMPTGDSIVINKCNCADDREGSYCEKQRDVCKQCYDINMCNTTNPDQNCTCPEGLEGNGIHCYDVDECANNKCSQICSNFIGGYNCSCKPGFTLEGKGTCIDIDECKSETSNNCTDRQYCSNTPGGFTCTCKAMYKETSKNVCEKVAVIYGGSLVFDSVPGKQQWKPALEDKTSTEFKALSSVVEQAIVEAFKKSDKTKTSIVIVTVTKFSKFGESTRRKREVDPVVKIEAEYEASFKQPVAELDLQAAINDERKSCSTNSDCTFKDIIGVSFNDSSISAHYDRCLSDEHNNCQKASTDCQSANGTFTCVCKDGFKPWDRADNVCEDIDECMGSADNTTLLKKVCGEEGEKCNNAPGTYTCNCKTDFDFDSTLKTCALTDHCKSAPCLHDSECVNLRGDPGYACKCSYGRTGPTCKDEDKEALRQRTIIIAVSATLGVLSLLLIIALCYMCAKGSRKKSSNHSMNMEEYSKFQGLPRAHLTGHDNAMMENGSTLNLYDPDGSVAEKRTANTDRVTNFDSDTLDSLEQGGNYQNPSYMTIESLKENNKIYSDPAVPF